MAHPYVGTEHLLLGLRKVYTGVAAQVLGANGVDEENIQKVMSELISPSGEMTGRKRPEFSPRLEYILEDSKVEAGTIPFRRDWNRAYADSTYP